MEPELNADPVREELAELADIVRCLAAESPARTYLLRRVDDVINRLIGDGCGPHNDGDKAENDV